ncbi:MAG: tetratricopeptide repeat protein [Ferruginibacter sp.]
MKRILITCCLAFLLGGTVGAQSAKEMQETARSFTAQGDFTNAILILNRATALAPNDIDITKDLALNYYLQKDNNKALEVIKPVLDRDDADDQCYQIAGNIYKQLEMVKECDKLFRKGIKKFPESGAMYNELGELLWAQKDYSAIKQWEKGIETDPNYPKNYYNACKYYYFTADKTWSILYGEIFINMEPMSNRTAEVKTILLESYKKLFTDADLSKDNKDKKSFSGAFLETMNKESLAASNGINPESLTMIRTRFILDWYENNAEKFPFRLFEHQRHLLKEGLFDAYNQWIFGAAQNLAAYQNWVNLNAQASSELARFQKGRTFKIPTGQYYH